VQPSSPGRGPACAASVAQVVRGMGATACTAGRPGKDDSRGAGCAPGDCEESIVHACGDGPPVLEWGTMAVQELRLLRASSEGDLERVHDLLAAGTWVDTRKKPSLHPRVDDSADYGLQPGEAPIPEGELLELDASGKFGKPGDGKAEQEQRGGRGVGLTPLMCAAQGGHVKVVQLLLRAGAHPCSQDEDGMAPIHFAAAAACRDCCSALVLAGAQPHARDDDGRDAFSCVPREAMMTRAERESWMELLGGGGIAEKAADAAEETLSSCSTEGAETRCL